MIFQPQPFLVFAPMATVGHSVFRRLVEDWGGCSLFFTEMIDAGAHLSGRPAERYYADSSPCPEKLIFQIVGADEDNLVSAASSLASLDCAGIDINMGCSAPHIFRQGAGIAWMTDPERAGRLATRLRQAVGEKSLSMKLRLGETEDEGSLIALAKSLQDSGADFLTLHPRIRKDRLSRPARWEWVTTLRESLSIPVVGNGDLEAVCLRFHELLEAHQPPQFWLSRSRRFYFYFCMNLDFGHKWGAQLQSVRDYDQLLAHVISFWKSNSEYRFVLASSIE